MSHPNPSIAMARTLVDELTRHGVRYAVISPGSRSTALALAVAETTEIRSRVVLDERAAGFNALGWARATGVPALVIATSGTAVANHLPAIVESDYSSVPMIVLSADRPPELLGIGSNQTVRQAGMFERWSRFSVDVGAATTDVDSNRYWRTLVSQAVGRSLGHGGSPGPVHLNVQFREPTVAVSDDGRSTTEPYLFSTVGMPDDAPYQAQVVAKPGGADLSGLSGLQGLVIAGEGRYDRRGLAAECQRLGWPLLATAQSGMRSIPTVTTYDHLLVDGVPESLEPSAVLTVGRPGPSDRLFSLTRLDVPQVHLDRWGRWHDPKRNMTLMAEADPVASLRTIDAGDAWSQVWTDHDESMNTRLAEVTSGEALSGPGIARALESVEGAPLVVGSSMAIRDVDAHLRRSHRVYANRGVSGIDGFVGTAFGVAEAEGGTVALCGDLSFLHGVAGLVVDESPPVTFVVVDNNGGGLFDLLPQATHVAGFERLFIAPHHKDLAGVARAMGAEVSIAESVEELTMGLSGWKGNHGVRVIVVKVDREHDLKVRHRLDDAARELLGS